MNPPPDKNLKPLAVYGGSDPYVYCPFCQATFRTDPMDATCRLCRRFFRDMGKIESPLLQALARSEAEVKELRTFQEVMQPHLESQIKQDGEKIVKLEESVRYSNQILDLLLEWVRLTRKFTVEVSTENEVEAHSMNEKLSESIKAANDCIAMNKEALGGEAVKHEIN